ncbi:TIGR00282 family metallophosphoesterase [Candidatus Desantisbacteria bacterium]|nr:TIGR00282 family metallophosphoesterase [Candidatus Desantisbacteria bacterium]
MNILFIGDVIGSPGRKALSSALPGLKDRFNIDITILNGENAAGGFGLTPEIANVLFLMGIDVITSGNHIWDKKDIIEIFEKEKNLLRPANYPEGVPGNGSGIYCVGEQKIGVINIAGRAFMANLDCPFKTVDKELEKMKNITGCIIVDIHAEATSEKMAIGWYLDSRVSAVIGTHTHVQTADERILPGGTAYITDAGMTGSRDSVIGMKKEHAIEKFLTQIPVKFETAKKNLWVCGLFVSINNSTGKAESIERVNVKVDD